jgi:hypothetical protein
MIDILVVGCVSLNDGGLDRVGRKTCVILERVMSAPEITFFKM